MPFKIRGKTYRPKERHGTKKQYSTFRYKKSGNAYLLLGKKRGGKWTLYELLVPR